MKHELIRLSNAAAMVGVTHTTWIKWIERGVVPAPRHRLPGLKGKGYTMGEFLDIQKHISGRLPRETVIKRFEGEGETPRDRMKSALQSAAHFLDHAASEFPELSQRIEFAKVAVECEPEAVELWVRI